MNIDELMVKVQNSITRSIHMFIGTAATPKQRSQIRANVLQVLEPYYYHGFIDTVPLVDVNHEIELDWLAKRISLMRSLIDHPEYDNKSLNQGIKELGARYTMLKNDIQNENNIYVFLKNPETFGRIVWTPRGEYDQ